MKNMKTIKNLFLMLLVVTMLIGCSNKKDSKDVSSEGQKKVVTVTTSFLYDMVKELAGDKVDINLVIPAGDDPHLYVAKPDDLNKIKTADLVLYHGLHFEGKMSDVLEKMGKSVTENFTDDEIGVMEEDGENVIDPHFWFDISLYKKATENAAKYLVEILPEDEEFINSNLEKYLISLDDLSSWAKEEINKIPNESKYLITPHDAFNYFSRYFGMEVMAPQGVSTDSETSNKDIDRTVDFIVSHKIKSIFAESTTDPIRMEKLKEAASAKGFEVKVVSGEGHELFSDSLAPIGEDGDTYITMYKHNINLIVDNLK